ncbi:YodC family protein [bacterium]|nr:YodC family protein [bacterium]MBU4510777.1 YodC family protein [bacterium]
MSNSESSQKLKTGDTVQLKSGGPIMTNESTNERAGYATQIKCQWFTGDEDKVREGYFSPDSLKLFVK